MAAKVNRPASTDTSPRSGLLSRSEALVLSVVWSNATIKFARMSDILFGLGLVQAGLFVIFNGARMVGNTESFFVDQFR